MKELLNELGKKGYNIHNKRILGNPKYTSDETKIKDNTQEIALIVEWLRVEKGIWVNTVVEDDKWTYAIKRVKNDYASLTTVNLEFNSPQESYLSAISYILNNLI